MDLALLFGPSRLGPDPATPSRTPSKAAPSTGSARSPLGDRSNVPTAVTPKADDQLKSGVGAAPQTSPSLPVPSPAPPLAPSDTDSPPQTGPDDGVPPTANAIATAGLSMATASATVAEPEEAPELWSGLSSCDLHGAFEAELLQQSAELRRSDAPIGGGDPAWGRPLTPGVDAPMLVADHSGLQPPLAAAEDGKGSFVSLASSSALTAEVDSEALLRAPLLDDGEAGAQSLPGSGRATPSPATYCGRKLRHLEGMLKLSVQRLLQVEAQKRAMQAALQREIAALQLQLSGVLRVNAADLTAAQGEAALLRRENERKARRIEELQRERAALIAEVEWCRAAAQRAEERSAAAEADFQRLKGGLEAKDSAIVELRRRTDQLQQELEITRFDHRESKCMLCNIDFTLFRRPHHCRKCHRVACNRCAPERPQPEFPDLGLKPTRICTTCVEIRVAEALGVM
eukprot:EG_transcript_7644